MIESNKCRIKLLFCMFDSQGSSVKNQKAVLLVKSRVGLEFLECHLLDVCLAIPLIRCDIKCFMETYSTS